MCGIVGVAGNISVSTEKLFSNLLLIDVLRGKDSTGVVRVDKKTLKSSWRKNAVASPYFMDENYDSFIGESSSILIGHNRAATLGKVNTTNAHPFTHGNITGVHNGTLDDVTLLPKHQDFEVDSDNLVYSIATQGIDKTYKALDGAAALVWYDHSNHNLYFIRNTKRPLYYGFLEHSNVLVWASDPNMLLYGVANTRGCKLKEGKVYPFEEHHLYTVKMVKNVNSNYSLKPKVRKLDPYVYVYKHRNYNRGSSTTTPSTTKVNSGLPARSVSKGNVVPITGENTVLTPIRKSSLNKNPKAIVGKEISFGMERSETAYSFEGWSHSERVPCRVHMGGSKASSPLSKIFNQYRAGKARDIIVRGRARMLSVQDGFIIVDPNSCIVVAKTIPMDKGVSKEKKNGAASETKEVSGGSMSRKTFDIVVSSGCLCCGHVPKYEEREDIYWHYDGASFTCSEFCNTYFIREGHKWLN